MESQNNIRGKLAGNIVKAEMKRRDINYDELALELAKIGVEMNVATLRNKVNRGTFSALFFMDALIVIGVKTLHLDEG